MKNLKRALSLALSSVMLFGMMVVGTGAASYDDVKATDNVAAIEVVKTAGIMEGDEKGNFNPDQKVTRNEMAVIMCNILDYNVAQYKGTAPFTDVPAWAEPFVAACYTHGIISGYDAKTFGGDDEVSSAQASLMLMKALGYFQHQADFGDDWQLATVRYGSKAGLYNNIESAVNAALTRNEIAQMVLNALEADMVEWTGDLGTQITTTDGTEINIGYVAYYNALPFLANKNYDNSSQNPSNNEKGSTLQLIEKLYGDDFNKNGDQDAFGRPSTKWTYKLDTVGNFPVAATATYTKGVSRHDMFNLLSSSVRSNLKDGTNDLYYYVDGANTTNIAVDADADNKVGNTDINGNTKRDDYTAPANVAEFDLIFKKNDKNSVTGTGNGVLTEVYVRANGDVYVVLTETYLVAAAGDYNTVKGEVRFAQYEDAIWPTLNAGQSTLSSDDWTGLEDVKDGDFLLVTIADGDVMSVAFAETVEGTVDSYTKSHDVSDGKKVTLSGTTYDYSFNAGGQDDLDFTVGQSAALVLDQYGYVIAVADTMINHNFVYVLDAGNVAGLMGSEVKAVVAYPDGTLETVVLNKVNNNKATGGEAGWYNYAKTSTGALNLISYNSNYDMWNVTQNGPVARAVNPAYKVSANKMFVDGKRVDALSNLGCGLLMNSKSVLVVVDPAMDATVYVGAENMPTIKAAATGIAGTEEYTVEVLSKDGYVTFAIVSFASKTNANDVHDFQIIDENAKAEFLFLLEEDSKHFVENGVTYFTYDTLKADGTIEKITYDSTGAEALWNLLYRPNYNKDGYVVDGVIVNGGINAYFNLQTIAGNIQDYAVGGQAAYDKTAKLFGVNHNNNTLSFYNFSTDTTVANFITTKDTQIFLILDGDTGLTKYAGVNYEVNEVTAATVANVLKGIGFGGRVAGKTVTDTSNVLEALYIYVDEV